LNLSKFQRRMDQIQNENELFSNWLSNQIIWAPEGATQSRETQGSSTSTTRSPGGEESSIWNTERLQKYRRVKKQELNDVKLENENLKTEVAWLKKDLEEICTHFRESMNGLVKENEYLKTEVERLRTELHTLLQSNQAARNEHVMQMKLDLLACAVGELREKELNWKTEKEYLYNTLDQLDRRVRDQAFALEKMLVEVESFSKLKSNIATWYQMLPPRSPFRISLLHHVFKDESLREAQDICPTISSPLFSRSKELEPVNDISFKIKCPIGIHRTVSIQRRETAWHIMDELIPFMSGREYRLQLQDDKYLYQQYLDILHERDPGAKAVSKTYFIEQIVHKENVRHSQKPRFCDHCILFEQYENGEVDLEDNDVAALRQHREDWYAQSQAFQADKMKVAQGGERDTDSNGFLPDSNRHDTSDFVLCNLYS
jgi:cell division protein FtsB